MAATVLGYLTKEEAASAVKATRGRGLHCFIRNIGATWDKKDVYKAIREAGDIFWTRHPLGHDLVVTDREGRHLCFDVQRAEVE